MRVAVWPAPAAPFAATAAVVAHCDATGWDGAYVVDHFMNDTPDGAADDAPVLEAFTLLAALVGRTERIRLGPLVLGNTYRHPAVVAKSAVTLDHISGGRFVLGLGAGWQVNEHRAYGIDLPPVAERMDRYEEACLAIRALLDEPRATLAGRHYRLTDAPCEPSPAVGRVPILIGAKGPRRGLRIAALVADEWNSWATLDQFRERSAVLAGHCEAIGRDPATIRRSTQAFVRLVDDPAEAERARAAAGGRPILAGSPAEVVDRLGAYAEAGLDEFIVPDWSDRPVERRLDDLDRFRTEVVAALP